MLRALKAEALKLKRSTMPLWTALTVVLAPSSIVLSLVSVEGGFERTTSAYFLQVGPGLLANYEGVMLFGLVAAYLFGREYSEGTAKHMLTLPIRREYFVVAKVTLLAVWVLLLTLLAVAVQVAYAAILGLKGFAWAHVGTCLTDSLTVALLIFLTLPIVALLAMLGEGYLQPMIFSGVMATAGMSLAFAGWERWFPWAMPVGAAGIVLGPPIEVRPLVPASWAIAFATFAVGLAAVIWYVDNADNTE
ncbi:MAG: ABC transporter permease [Coriobacteriia bacterium]